MTASFSTTGRVARSSISDRLLGLAPLMRKDAGEWRTGVRIWVILAVTSLFMALTAANSAIAQWVIANGSDGADVPAALSPEPLPNFMAAFGSQIFVVVAIFAAISLLVAEREHGTLAWVASKPVSRAAIWLSKWTVASAAIIVSAGLVPLLITVGVVIALYGALPATVVVLTAFGMAASIAFIVAVVLAASTVVRSQAAVAGIGFVVFFLPSILVGLAPVDIVTWLPTSILPWAVALGTGAPVGFETPLAWSISIAALVAFAAWRMERLEP